jgi:hypothetical protein
MPFPDITLFRPSHTGPYELGMGEVIGRLLDLFRDHVPDAESAAHVGELAATPRLWSAGHAVFDEVRRRTLAAIKAKDAARLAQYGFEEKCCQSLYNATDARDPFDASAPFFVAPAAFRLAEAVGLPVDAVVSVLAPTKPRNPAAK